MTRPLSLCLRSLDGNYLGEGGDMSGILKLAEVLPKSQLTSLRSAATPLNLT